MTNNFPVPTQYGRDHFAIPAEKVDEWMQLEPVRSWGAWAMIWVQIGLFVALGHWLLAAPIRWLGLPILIFFLAGRQGALLQLVHEAGHQLISMNARVNDFFGYWLCGLPIGVNYYGYSAGHRMHHAHAGTELDPPSDREKYRITRLRDPQLYLLFLKDFLGLSALSVLFAYEARSADGKSSAADTGGPAPRRHFLQLCLVQLGMLGLLFQFNIAAYILLWLVPAACAHMVLMRVRGMAEHGLARQLAQAVHSAPEGTYFTRSFLTPQNSYALRPLVWVEKMLIGSLAVHYHHEHHLYPSVPFYHLKKVHEQIAGEVNSLNPNTYAKGYFAAAFLGPREKVLL